MTFVWLIAAAGVPFLIGNGLLTAIYGKKENRMGSREYLTRTDGLILGWLICIGVGEAVHLAGVFLDQPLSALVKWELLLTAGVTAAALAAAAVRLRLKAKQGKAEKADARPYRRSRRYLCLAAVLALAACLTLVYVVISGAVYLTGDMTAETVESFRTTDALYSVNPMTGQAYQGGIPTRLQILCLPTLYAIACELTGLETTELVWHLIPGLVLIGSLAAYFTLAGSLFPDRPEEDDTQRERAACRRLTFVLLVLIAFWVGNSAYGMDGFDLLNSGFRAVTIRGAVLIPYGIACMLRRKYLPVLLCIAAEACILWTLYGLGAAVLTAAGMWLAGKWADRRAAEC